MSYQTVDALTNEPTFNGRVKACVTEQAHTYKDDARPQFVALADEMLRTGGGDPMWSFIRMAAAAPGLADQADQGDGTIDQALVTDADLLTVTQANWETVAGLFYDEEGIPI